MKSITIATYLLLIVISALSQSKWNSAQLSQMPEAISNNAVISATSGGQQYVYSFSGIDTSKIYSGISLKAFRYDVSGDSWTMIDSLPDSMGKIAAGSSVVKNKIYIIGGYNVFPNGSEVSSSKTHIFDPKTSAYLSDGMDIPVPIDDQVQAVWRDSLIYVITGWSNSANVNSVQIYDPTANMWMTGTPTPNIDEFKVFGGSGVIIGDTIYYAGGASNWNGSTFPLTNIFRKGAIDPNDPTQIVWSIRMDTLARGYRMGAAVFDNKAIWFGGSQNSYNYDGIAYDGSGGVAATGRVLVYDPATGDLTVDTNMISPVMDIRGVAQVAHNQFIIAGGMLDGQQVTSQTQLITYGQLTGIESNVFEREISVYPNPTSGWISIDAPGIKQGEELVVQITDFSGKLAHQSVYQCDGNQILLDIEHLNQGLYFLQVRFSGLAYNDRILKMK